MADGSLPAELDPGPPDDEGLSAGDTWIELSVQADLEAVEAVSEILSRFAPGGTSVEPGFELIDEGLGARVDPNRPGVAKPVWARGDRTWWRNRPEFRAYTGARPGMWFRPGFGYVRVDPRWYGYGWRVGGHVPLEFRGYYVQSPDLFGLGRAPYGYVYVYLGNNIALMQRATGLIVQVYPNIY